MSSAILYFGAPLKNKQSVPDNIRALNLDLMPTAPSKLGITSVLKYVQPGYSFYKRALPLFVKSAMEDVTVSAFEPCFYTPGLSHVPSFEIIPDIIWSYNYELSPDAINEVKSKFFAKETQTNNGKLAFVAKWHSADWWKALKEEKSINRQTYAPSSTMNMSSFVHYIIIMRIIDWFMRINQYAAYKTSKVDDLTETGEVGNSDAPPVEKSYPKFDDDGVMKSAVDILLGDPIETDQAFRRNFTSQNLRSKGSTPIFQIRLTPISTLITVETVS